MSIRKNSIYNIINLSTNYIIPILTIPLFISNFSITEYGVSVIVISIAGAVASITGYNLDNIAPSIFKIIPTKNEFIGGFILIRTIIFITSSLLALILVLLINRNILIYTSISLISIVGIIFNTSHFFIASENFKSLVKYNIFSKLISLFGIIISCTIFKHIELYIFSSLFWLSLSSIITFIKSGPYIVTNTKKIKKFISITFSSFIGNIYISISIYLIQPIIGAIVGYELSGVFSIYDKLIKALNGVVNAIYSTMLSNKEILNIKITKNLVNIETTSITMLFIILLASISIIYISFKNYIPHNINIIYILISISVVYFSSINNYITSMMFTRLFRFSDNNRCILISISLSMPCLILLTYKLNVIGSLLGLLINEIISCGLKWKEINREI